MDPRCTDKQKFFRESIVFLGVEQNQSNVDFSGKIELVDDFFKFLFDYFNI